MSSPIVYGLADITPETKCTSLDISLQMYFQINTVIFVN